MVQGSEGQALTCAIVVIDQKVCLLLRKMNCK